MGKVSQERALAGLTGVVPSFPATPLPFAVGQSPFRARGLLYQGARDFYETIVPGGAAAVRGMLDPELGAFFAQMFTPSLLFDALPIVAISAGVARALKQPHYDLVRQNARWLAERDIRGVHRLLLGVLSPSTVAQRLPRAALRYFDFGKAEAAMVGDKTCDARQYEIPAYLAAWFVAAVEGFVPVALQKAGGKMPRVRSTGASAAKAPETPITLGFEFSWL